MTQAEAQPANSMTVRDDQPLIGVFAHENGRDVVRYFTDEEAADTTLGPTSVQKALKLAGAWKDLADWAEVEEDLERIRHQSPLTPPLDDL
jgi:hypothetical protein